jgi:integrase
MGDRGAARDASPFIRTRGRTLKHDESGRDRRLREGEEAGLLEHANAHLKDLITAALETGMRKGELLGLQWKDVRWLQNEIRLPRPEDEGATRPEDPHLANVA